MRPILFIAVMLSLALMCGGFFTGYGTNLLENTHWYVRPLVASSESWSAAFWRIMSFNLPALCLGFSGAITAGLTTLTLWPLTAVYIGTTMRVACEQLGMEAVLNSIWSYAPFEFSALMLAAGAGLMPITSVIHSAYMSDGRSPLLGRYFGVLPQSLRVFGMAAALLIAAALIEATVIANKGV